jgi:hypothetical protein
MQTNSNRILVEVGETGFEVIATTPGGTPGELRVALTPNRLARGLSDIALLLAATRGEVTSGLRSHLTGHFAPSARPDAKCEFCKLQGRILAAEGRRRLTEREQRDRAKPPQVTVLRTGATGAAGERAFEHAAKREAERLRKLPRLNGVKVGRDTEGVWF